MRYRNALTAIALAATATFTGCELQPGQPHHITVTELEAPWVDVTPPTELWIEMITEGDFKERCATNFGGTFRSDSNGRLCIVTNP
jgi:hypothetical protein